MKNKIWCNFFLLVEVFALLTVSFNYLCLFKTSFFMRDFKIGTLNLNGARDGQKRMCLFEFIKQKHIDVAFVQESHSDLNNEVDWKKEWDGEICLSHMSSNSGGVAILFSKKSLPISCDIEEIVKGRCLKVKANFENTTMTFLNIYAPTKGDERIAFFDTISVVMKDLSSEELFVLGGDFNCTENDKLDRNHLEPHIASQKALVQLLRTFDLCDVWRNVHHKNRQYTWAHSRDNIISMARLDRFYVSNHQVNLARECKIIPVGFSDHCAVVCNIFINSGYLKSAYWHFNTSLLNDKKFIEIFYLFWENFKKQKEFYISLQQWWDCGKVYIKQLCQEYTFNATKDMAQSMKILENEIIELLNTTASTSDGVCFESSKSKKEMLADLLGIKAQGALIRSRFQSISQMDAPSKFFFNLERKNGQSRIIHSLRSDTGKELTEPSEISKYAVGFYSDLYKCELSQREDNDFTFLNDLPKIDEESNRMLEQTLSQNELYTAMMRMENGKTPGIDGIPVDFYKILWPVIGEDFFLVLNDSLNRGLLPLSCRRAVITLLPKKGDLQNISNWRPISLLCADYKILSKALATRLSQVLSQVIHSDQNYCIPNRSILDNISLVRDVLEVARLFGVNGGLISLDQEKAFDRVEHAYLREALEAFGFSQVFINMIEAMYCDIESVLKVNGGLSAPFRIQRGVRQGCAMSGMLYSLAIEPLLHKLRNELCGFTIPYCNVTLHLSAYADDVVVFVSGADDIKKLKIIVNSFKKISSAKVNWGKSEALLMGDWDRSPPSLPEGLIWKKGGFKYLGIFLGNDDFGTKNWDCMLEKIKGRLQKWNWLLPKLSYRGRTLIINNLVGSSLWHKLACVDPPLGLLPKLQAEMVNFFWDNLHWTPQSVLFLPRDEGGQGLVNLVSRGATFRLQFIQRLLMGPQNLVWRPLAQTILSGVNGMGLHAALFLMDYTLLDLSRLPSFYKSLFKVWRLFKHEWTESATSLFWLLEEPVVFGSRLDVSGVDLPGLKNLLVSKKLLQLKDIFEKAGPGLKDAETVAIHLGIRSVRVVSSFLNKLDGVLNSKEKALLESYSMGDIVPDANDLFPDIRSTPDLEESSHNSPLLCLNKNENVDFCTVKGKILYKCIVKVINKHTLKDRIDTVWRDKLGVVEEIKPEWRVLYKPPLTKRAGDLQWRILHGAIAVNAFVTKLNPTVNDICPFCLERETIFHCFLNCGRLSPLFDLLEFLFSLLGISFTKQCFIFGFKYSRLQKYKCQLMNFIVGQAKLAIYISRRNEIEQRNGQHIVSVFKNMFKSRILVDFNYYKMMNAIKVFEIEWCCDVGMYSILNNELFFICDLR